ncbi:MAG: hypothetical protein ACE5HF_03285 [Gemmatimonadota bacterium]
MGLETAPARSRARLGPVNWGLFTAAAISIAAGYLSLARGSTVAAPLLLVMGYAVLVPAGLLYGLGRGGRGHAGE